MKTFYLSLFLFILLVGLIVGNAIFVRYTTAALEKDIGALPSITDAGAALDTLEMLWQKRRIWLSLSVPAGQMLHFETAFSGMRSAVKNGDAADYEIYRAQALLAVRGLARLERFSAENLL